MLILGCGNTERGDDAAGLLVIDRLQKMGIDAAAFCGDPLDLVDRWDVDSDVLLIDAVVTNAPAGSIHAFNPGQLRTLQSPTSTHGLGVSEAIELAKILGRLPARLRIYAIEGKSFDTGNSVSPQVMEAVETLALQIANECRASVDL